MQSATKQETRSILSEAEVASLRLDFPALAQCVNGFPLAYLDNAATTQKPQAVIAAMEHFYAHDNANVRRGAHTLSERATAAYEAARQRVARFINAATADECLFVRGTTEAINLVARSYLQPRLQSGDEILLTHLEHHANIVPWQLVAAQCGAKLVVVPVLDSGEVDMEAFAERLSARTRMVAVAHVSNALGSVNPVAQMVALARERGVPTLLDGAQAVSHLKIDVQQLGCDFYAFSGHKLYGPTGIGVLWARDEHLQAMPPWQGGGEMITRVSFDSSSYAPPPRRFEAGTPPISGAIGLAAAIDYLTALGVDRVAAYEQSLLAQTIEMAASVPSLIRFGSAMVQAPIFSFTLGEIHPHDISTVLDSYGIAVRAGHHCAMPLMERFGVAATARVSFAFYNTAEEVRRLFAALTEAEQLFRR